MADEAKKDPAAGEHINIKVVDSVGRGWSWWSWWWW